MRPRVCARLQSFVGLLSLGLEQMRRRIVRGRRRQLPADEPRKVFYSSINRLRFRLLYVRDWNTTKVTRIEATNQLRTGILRRTVGRRQKAEGSEQEKRFCCLLLSAFSLFQLRIPQSVEFVGVALPD